MPSPPLLILFALFCSRKSRPWVWWFRGFLDPFSKPPDLVVLLGTPWHNVVKMSSRVVTESFSRQVLLGEGVWERKSSLDRGRDICFPGTGQGTVVERMLQGLQRKGRSKPFAASGHTQASVLQPRERVWLSQTLPQTASHREPRRALPSVRTRSSAYHGGILTALWFYLSGVLSSLLLLWQLVGGVSTFKSGAGTELTGGWPCEATQRIQGGWTQMQEWGVNQKFHFFFWVLLHSLSNCSSLF